MFVKFNVQLIRDVQLPTRAHDDDAGLDVYAYQDWLLKENEITEVKFGFKAEFHPGFMAMLCDKSKMGARGIHCHGGVIDCGYRGEWAALLINHAGIPYTIKEGEKICQIVFFPIVYPTVIQVQELSLSIRGPGGFGSTGK